MLWVWADAVVEPPEPEDAADPAISCARVNVVSSVFTVAVDRALIGIAVILGLLSAVACAVTAVLLVELSPSAMLLMISANVVPTMGTTSSKDASVWSDTAI